MEIISKNKFYLAAHKKMRFRVKKFKDLSLQELYDIMQLRQEVFAVEQNCAYLDADGKDGESIHVMSYTHSTLIAYARILPPGLAYKGPAIGRVIVKFEARGKKLAYRLMEKSIREAIGMYHPKTITISAQTYLEKFYSKIGFKSKGKVYIEDDFPHIKMIYTITI